MKSAGLLRHRAILLTVLVAWTTIPTACSYQTHSFTSETQMTRRGAPSPLCLHEHVEPATPIVGLFIGISHFRGDKILGTPAHALAAAVMAEPFFHAARSAAADTPVFAELRAPVYAYTRDDVGRRVHSSLRRLHALGLSWAHTSGWDDEQYLELALDGVAGFSEDPIRSSRWADRKSERFVPRESLLSLVDAAAAKAAELRRDRRAAILVVYLSSHGWIGPDGRQYIAPSDADPDRPASWVAYEEILDRLKTAQAGGLSDGDPHDTLVFFDACQFKLEGATELRPIQAPPGTVVVTAAAPGQYSYHWARKEELGWGSTDVSSERRFGFPKPPPRAARGPFVLEFLAKMSVIPRANQLAIRQRAGSLHSRVGEDEKAVRSAQLSVEDWARDLLEHKDEALSESAVFAQEPGAQQDIVVLEGPGRGGGPFLVLSGVGHTIENGDPSAGGDPEAAEEPPSSVP